MTLKEFSETIQNERLNIKKMNWVLISDVILAENY